MSSDLIVHCLSKEAFMRANILVFYQQQNLGQRVGQMHLKADIHSNAMILLLFFIVLLLLPLCVRVLCWVLGLWFGSCRPFWFGDRFTGEERAGCFALVVLRLSVLYVVSSRCCVIVCSLPFRHFLFTLTFFNK